MTSFKTIKFALVEHQDQPVMIVDEIAQEKKQNRMTLIYRVIVGILIISGWEFLTQVKLLDSFFWSSPSRIVGLAYVQFAEKNLLFEIAFTMGSTVIGFITGTVFGAMLGMSFWWSKSYAGVSEPYLIMLNALPKLSLAPILVIMFGIGFPSKVALSFLMTVITCAIATFGGVKSVDHSMETLLYSLGASRWQVFFKVVIPSTMPWIVSCLRINISLALTGSIVGEFISSQHGVGRMISYAGSVFDTNLIWVGVVILSILALVIYGSVALLETWLMQHSKVLQHH
jgi:NitT/TauT family transport system permease protein